MMDLSNRRECFFDGTLVNDARTTAEFLVHKPIRKGTAITFDAPWENGGCTYPNFFKDGDIYRMYYLPFDNTSKYVCYAESRDGLHWEKPILNVCDYNGSTENNVIVVPSMVGCPFDNFMVFKDENPACPPEKKYKGIMSLDRDGVHGLYVLFSGDGIHFSYGDVVTTKGAFD